MVEVLHAVVVAVKHLSIDNQPEGVGAGHLDKGALAVLHQLLDIRAVDMGTMAVFVDEAGEFEQRHPLEEVDFDKTVVVQ